MSSDRKFAYPVQQHGDPRTDLNRRRRLARLRERYRNLGVADVTQRQVDLDPVLQKALAERLVRVRDDLKPTPLDKISARDLVDPRVSAALLTLNDAAREVLGSGEWICLRDWRPAAAGYRHKLWAFHCSRQFFASERRWFDTRDELLDHYDADTPAYLEWAAGRGY